MCIYMCETVGVSEGESPIFLSFFLSLSRPFFYLSCSNFKSIIKYVTLNDNLVVHYSAQEKYLFYQADHVSYGFFLYYYQSE